MLELLRCVVSRTNNPSLTENEQKLSTRGTCTCSGSLGANIACAGGGAKPDVVVPANQKPPSSPTFSRLGFSAASTGWSLLDEYSVTLCVKADQMDHRGVLVAVLTLGPGLERADLGMGVLNYCTTWVWKVVV